MKHVLVTGASSGIGQDCVRVLSKAGFRVHAAVRKTVDASAWSDYPNVEPILFDVTDEESCVKAWSILEPKLSLANEIHLVNNAGIAVGGPVEGVPLEEWRKQFEVNVFGLLRITQLMLPMVREKRGRIVNISSVSGLTALPFLGPYCASKFAVEAISDSLRRELRSSGAKVILIEPGSVATPIWEKSMAGPIQLPAALERTYGREVGSFLSLIREAAANAIPVRMVSQVIEKALTDPNPRPRYLVVAGRDRIRGVLLRYLPDRWVDAMLGKLIS
jgi:NAD(P)-dependent dehydrogenase (short-subunit alcohol dehydrogenase family)